MSPLFSKTAKRTMCSAVLKLRLVLDKVQNAFVNSIKLNPFASHKFQIVNNFGNLVKATPSLNSGQKKMTTECPIVSLFPYSPGQQP